MLIIQGENLRFEEALGISALLGQVEHQLSQKIEQSIRHFGITLPQYSTLSAIEANQNLTNADLARKCFVAPQTMNRILQNLLKMNLVKKNKNVFSLTAKSEKLVCDAHIIVNAIEVQLTKSLNKREFAEFQKTLEGFIRNLE